MALDPNNLLSYSVWLQLPMNVRYDVAKMFGFVPRGIREVMDGRIISDGFVHSDLSVITKEKMREITGMKSDDFYVLFDAVIARVQGKVVEPPAAKIETKAETNANVEQKESAEVKSAGKVGRGRPKKGGK